MSRLQPSIVILWLAGVLSVAQLAKISVLATALAEQFALNAVQTGFLISLLEVGGAVFGIVAGLFLNRIGARRALKIGILVLFGTTIIEALTPRTAILFGARAIEGLGYLFVVISAPTIMLGIVDTTARRVGAMLLWSTFVPIGLGVGSAVTGLAVQIAPPQLSMLLWALILFLLLIAITPIDQPSIVDRKIAMPAKAAWLLSASFGFYTFCLCGVAGLMPIFVSDQFSGGATEGGLIAGLVSFGAVPGTLMAAVAMRRFDDGRHSLSVFLTIVTMAAAGIAPWIYRSDDLKLSAGLGVLMLILAGIARAIIFARLPILGDPDGSGQRVAATQGLFTQAGATGALLGAPLGAAVVQFGGWEAFGISVSCCLAALIVTALLAEHTHRAIHKGNASR